MKIQGVFAGGPTLVWSLSNAENPPDELVGVIIRLLVICYLEIHGRHKTLSRLMLNFIKIISSPEPIPRRC